MVNLETRGHYSEYMAKGVRYALKETGLRQWPESTIVIVHGAYQPLADLDEILGWPIYVTNTPSSNEFGLAFKSYEEANYGLLKAFNEYLDIAPLEINDD